MRVLFVCAGNTCRSPLAEAIARDGADGSTSVEFGSAGWCAADGEGANPQAVEVARAHGLELVGHRARNLRSVAADYDLLLGMDNSAVQASEQLGAAGRSWLLTAYAGDASLREIADPLPIGTATAYEQTYEDLRRAVDLTLERLAGEGKI